MRITLIFVLVSAFILVPYHTYSFTSTDFSLLKDSIRHLMELENDDEAKILWEESLSLAKTVDSLTVYLDLIKLLAVAYRDRQDYTSLFSVYQRGAKEALWRQPINKKEGKSLGWLYSQIAYAYDIGLGKYVEAMNAYEIAETIFAKWKIVDTNVARFVWWRLGNIYTRLGDNSAAELKLKKVIKLMQVEDGEASHWLSEVYNDLGLLYRSWKRMGDAKLVFQEGLQKHKGRPMSKILLRLNYFDVLIAHEELTEANIQLNIAEKNLLSESSDYHFFLISSLLSKKEAVLSLKQERYADAMIALNKDFSNLQSFYGTTQRREFGKHYIQYGQVYKKQGDYQSAIQKFQEALKSTIYDYQPNGIYDLPSAESFYAENTIMEALDNMVETYQLWYEKEPKEEKLQIALQCHQLIYAVDQELRRSYLYDSSKLFNLEESRDRSEQGIEIAQQLYELSGDEKYLYEAFVFAERNRSSLLREAYRTTQANALAGISETELAAAEALKYEISEAQEELFRLRATADMPDSLVQKAEQQLFQARAALDDWITTLEANNPRYFQLKYADEVPDLERLQEMLCDEQLMVEYFIGQEQLYVFTLNNERLELHQLPLPEDLQKRVIEWRRNIQDYQHIGVDKAALEKAYQAEGHRLYLELLLPVLEGEVYTELLIVPSGILDLLPFEALLTQPVKGTMSFQEYPYLLNAYTVSYTYSASLQLWLDQLPRQGKGRIGFAPEFDGNNGWAPVRCSGNGLVAQLNESSDALRMGKEATIAAFTELAGRYRLLHLATHAQANPEQGDFSFIVFSDGTSGYDSLYAKDLYPLSIEAELVVLSACETALGTIYNSEGVISLARAFHFAGVRSVLTTLWSINDGANCSLMPVFYEQLEAGASKKEALRKAKQSMLEDPRLSHPAYWAGFQLLGNPRPLNEPSNKWWWLLMVLPLTAYGFYQYENVRTK